MLTGCSDQRVAYNKSAYKKKIHAGYTATLNKKVINPYFYFLDKENIDKVISDDKTRNISITQKNKDAALNLIKPVTGDRDTLHLLVVNGIHFQKQYLDSIVIETSAIKKISILKDDPKSTIRSYYGPIWIVVTK